MFTEGVDGDCTVVGSGLRVRNPSMLGPTTAESVFKIAILDLAMRLNEPQLSPKRLDRVMGLSDQQN